MGVYRPCASAWAWQVNIDGAAHLGDQVHAVTVDPNGDVVAAGTTQNNGTSSDFTVAKLSGATGATIWRRVVAGSAPVPSGEARAITLDAAGISSRRFHKQRERITGFRHRQARWRRRD